MADPVEVVHIAGQTVTINDGDTGQPRLFRQRCSWCGATLVDEDLTTIKMLDGGMPGAFRAGALVATVGDIGSMRAQWLVEPADGKLPDRACAQLDPAATR
jgi:hypothetical protein